MSPSHPRMTESLIAKEPAAEPDDPNVAIHEAGQDRCAPDDDREGKPESKHHEQKVAMRRGGDRQDVVETHRHVGHDDDPDRLPERGAVANLALTARLRSYELDGDPDQEESSHELEERDPEEDTDDRHEDQP